jgi:hypothetical protein
MPLLAPGTPATALIGRTALARAAAPAMPNIPVKNDRRSMETSNLLASETRVAKLKNSAVETKAKQTP